MIWFIVIALLLSQTVWAISPQDCLVYKNEADKYKEDARKVQPNKRFEDQEKYAYASLAFQIMADHYAACVLQIKIQDLESELEQLKRQIKTCN